MKAFFCVRDVIVFLFFSFSAAAQNNDDASFIRNNFSKKEVYITMRDGIKLFTAIYSPNDSARLPDPDGKDTLFLQPVW
jgi:hypothetical protein